MENKISITPEDLVNAGGLYKAKESEILETDADAETIGNMAGVMTDLKENELNYQSNKISDAEYRDNLKEIVVGGAIYFIDKAIDKGLDVLATFTSVYIPILTPVVATVKSVVKSIFINNIEKVAITVEKAFNWIRKKIFS